MQEKAWEKSQENVVFLENPEILDRCAHPEKQEELEKRHEMPD